MTFVSREDRKTMAVPTWAPLQVFPPLLYTGLPHLLMKPTQGSPLLFLSKSAAVVIAFASFSAALIYDL